jgi:hypothetical protein
LIFLEDETEELHPPKEDISRNQILVAVFGDTSESNNSLLKSSYRSREKSFGHTF